MVKLYHSTPYPAEDFRVINPGTRNVEINETPDGPVVHAVPYDENNTPYVYAADNAQLSITYAVHKGVRIGNLSLSGGEILFVDKESIIGDPKLEGGLFSFESDRFMQLRINGGMSAQWVSPYPVDLTKADFLRIRSLNDIMKAGVQVYQIADNPDCSAYQHYLDMGEAENDAALKTFLNSRIQSGALRWLNEERGIAPVNLLTDEAAPKMSGAKPLTLG